MPNNIIADRNEIGFGLNLAGDNINIHFGRQC